jgi:hypothetical protein
MLVMKNLFLTLLMIATCTFTHAQEDSTPEKAWNFNPEVNFYFMQDDFFMLPIIKADKNKLHLETRYNYEDRETFSAWAGYNFTGGNNLEYTITPMLGAIIGSSNGFAPGLEFTFTYKSFELYTEAEYLFDTDSGENNFYYQWSEITWSPKDWLWVGISGQRTRLYQTNLEIQRALLIGGGYKDIELTGYVYNLGFDDPFIQITLSASF